MIKKVGGIWFARIWRIRVLFCLARAPVQNSINIPRERISNYEHYLNGCHADGGR